MDKVTSRFKKIVNYSVLMEIFDIIVGIMLFVYTSFSIKICAVIIGALILVHGLFSLIRYFYDGLASRFFAMDLIVGVSGVILGLFLMFNTFDTLSFLGYLFAAWLIIVGLHRLVYGIKLVKINDEIYPLICMMGLLIVVMGCLVLFNPFESFMLITKLIGIFIVVNTIFEVMTLNLYKKRIEYLLDLFE